VRNRFKVLVVLHLHAINSFETCTMAKGFRLSALEWTRYSNVNKKDFFVFFILHGNVNIESKNKSLKVLSNFNLNV
jgi:hypothetical protein